MNATRPHRMAGAGPRPAKASPCATSVAVACAAIACVGVACSGIACAPARGESISQVLSRTYATSPDIAQARAAARVQDENVPKAKSGLRPQASANGSVGYLRQDLDQYGTSTRGASKPAAGSIQVLQPLFDGNKTRNGVRQAESGIAQAREQLRATEQATLLSGATAYMNVLRDGALHALQVDNVKVLEQQLRDTRMRFEAGEVTRTDLAQAAGALSGARTTLAGAKVALRTSLALYQQVNGAPPGRLEAARPLLSRIPAGLDEAVELARTENPLVAAALHASDAADLAVLVAEAALSPTIGLAAQASNQSGYDGVARDRVFNASVVAQLNIPIYDGGLTYANVRQAKEYAGQVRTQVDVQRRATDASVMAAWGRFEGARTAISSARATVRAAEAALSGVREEAKAGQRTTQDILFSQQGLLQARTALVAAQRDEVVSTYEILASVGRLDADALGLDVVRYDPTVHYGQVKDKWLGLRTPDGR